MATVRIGTADEVGVALPLIKAGRELAVSRAIRGHKAAFGSASISGGGDVHASGYATHPSPSTLDQYVPPQLQRVALDVGLGAAGAAVGAQVDGAVGAVVGGAAAVVWSRWRYPVPDEE
jgi:hypothetical protein